MKKWQLNGPEPATSRSIADPLAAEPWSPPASIHGSIAAGGDLGSAAKGSAIDLEIAGSGPVSYCFFIPSFFLPCVVL